MKEDKALIERSDKFKKSEFDIFESGYNSILVDIDCSTFVFDQHEEEYAIFEIQTEEELDLIIYKLESLRTVFTKNKSK